MPRSAASRRWGAVVLLVVALSLAGFLLITHAVNEERRSTARAQAEAEAQQTRTMLEHAGAFAAGLASALSSEPAPNGPRFDALVGSATTTIGLPDAMWVERVRASDRHAYEARIGGPITRLASSRRAGAAAVYLPATFVTGLPFHAGADTTSLSALAAALANPTSVFAGTATAQERVAGQLGFFLVQGAQFGRGPGSQGFLAVFVPAGWLALSPSATPNSSAISLEGHRIAGTLSREPAASQSFQALTRQWHVSVVEPPATAVQTLLPRLALVWAPAVALLVYLVGRGIARRRSAEREVDDIFDLSLDPLCILGMDGYLKRVNPAFEHTLGYDAQALLAHRVREFAHPDDRETVGGAIDGMRVAGAARPFEGRFQRADGAVRWLTWNMRPVPDRGLMYGAAYDITSTRLLVQEQTALRRVAELVAEGADTEQLFAAVAAEVGELLGADAARLLRYEAAGTASIVGAYGASDAALGVQAEAGSDDGELWRRLAEDAGAQAPNPSGDGSPSPPSGAIGGSFAAPIVVSGHSWGVIVAAWIREKPADPATGARLGQFTELVATAVANAESRAALAESRRRVVTSADEARRQIERDLHDGAQQRLVHGVVTLKLAQRKLREGSAGAAELVAQALETTESANQELRELARGIHPAILSRGGLAPALQSLAERSPIPVSLEVRTGARLPEGTEVTIYFVVSEALVNVAKHSEASAVEVVVERVDGGVRFSISDDGVGDADPARGSGLLGLRDRVEAAGGTLTVQSPPGAGTRLSAELPIAAH